MELTKSSKEIIDLEYRKIELIVVHLRNTGHRHDDPMRAALAIYSKVHEDISVIDDEEDEY